MASFRISAPVPLRPPVRRRAYGAADTAPGSAPAAACSSTADPSTSINTGGSSGSNIVPAADTGSAAATATADAVADSNTGTTDGCVIATARCDVERCNQLPVMSERYHFDGSLLAVSFPRGNTREDPGLGALVVMSSEQWEEERQRRRAERPAQRAGQHAAAAGQQQQQQQQRAAGRQQPGAGGEEEEEDEREPRQLHDIRCGGFFTGVECLCAGGLCVPTNVPVRTRTLGAHMARQPIFSEDACAPGLSVWSTMFACSMTACVPASSGHPPTTSHPAATRVVQMPPTAWCGLQPMVAGAVCG